MASAREAFTISADALAFIGVGGGRGTSGANLPSTPANGHGGDKVRKDDWAAIIEGRLAEWARDPAQLEDEDLTAPNAATIARAFLVARSLREQGAPPPCRVVPTGDGGIAFQFERGREFLSIEVEPEGLVELLVFDDGRLKHRSAL